MLLENKKVIVTGGGRGIGRAIALAFAKEGADVCVTARTKSEIESVADEIKALKQYSIAVPGDVTLPEDVDRVVQQTIDTFGKVDILINNAGGSAEENLGTKPVAESIPELWVRTIEINLVGTYLFSRAVLPNMIKNNSGKIINIGSGMGHRAHSLVGNSAYSAAKAAILMFTQSLSAEVWQYGIDVNELVPGPVETILTGSSFKIGKPVAFAGSERVKSPDEIGPLAVYLASQNKGGPTGQSFSLARRPL